MSEIVCFDTQILVWGLKKSATPGQEIKIHQAEYLISLCNERNDIVLIPSIVAGEILSSLPLNETNEFTTAVLQRKFRIVPYDIQAAAVFAMMWRDRQKLLQRNKQLSLGATREEVKADCMIAATAKAKGASCIYSEDVKLAKFAKEHIEVRPLPNLPPLQLEANYEDLR